MMYSFETNWTFDNHGAMQWITIAPCILLQYYSPIYWSGTNLHKWPQKLRSKHKLNGLMMLSFASLVIMETVAVGRECVVLLNQKIEITTCLVVIHRFTHWAIYNVCVRDSLIPASTFELIRVNPTEHKRALKEERIYTCTWSHGDWSER